MKRKKKSGFKFLWFVLVAALAGLVILAVNGHAENAIAGAQRLTAAFRLPETVTAPDISDGEYARLVAEQVETINALRSENQRLSAANANHQEALTIRANEVQALSAELSGLRDQLQALSAGSRLNERELEEQRRQYATLSRRNGELQSQLEDLQNRLETAMGFFQ